MDLFHKVSNVVTISFQLSKCIYTSVNFKDRYMLIKNFHRYKTKETTIKERFRQTSEGAEDASLPFIDFIVCPAYKFGYNFDELEKYGLKNFDYMFNGKWNPTVNESIEYNLHKVVSNICTSH